MATPRKRSTSSRTTRTEGSARPRRGRPKKCSVCTDQIEYVDYKDVGFLRRFMSERGKIKSRANTGTCVQHQSDVAIAIKTAREMALLPYAVRTAMGNKGGGRRGREPGAGRPSGPRPGAPADRPASGTEQGAAPGGADVAGGATPGDAGAPTEAEVVVGAASAEQEG